MPRVNYVKHARRAPGSCGGCGKKLGKGDPYKWWKFRYGGRRVRCDSPKCAPRQSDLTNSDKLSRCYSAGESIGDALDAFQKDHDLEALKSSMEDAASEIREVAEEYRESASNIESGMNNRMPICDELEEKADNLEGKADEIESTASNLEEFDEDGEEDGKSKDERREEWIEEVESQVSDYTNIDPEG